MHRVKLSKRHGYGRTNFDLLRGAARLRRVAAGQAPMSFHWGTLAPYWLLMHTAKLGHTLPFGIPRPFRLYWQKRSITACEGSTRTAARCTWFQSSQRIAALTAIGDPPRLRIYDDRVDMYHMVSEQVIDAHIRVYSDYPYRS